MEYKRAFAGIWVSKDLWENKELTALEKLILLAYESINEEYRHDVIADDIKELCNESESDIEEAVEHLRSLGYLNVEGYGIEATIKVVY